MIPILFDAYEAAFTSNGIGRLSDAISCIVTEERNGPYELEMQYPITGQYFSELQHSRIIYATPADGKDGQPFRIYRIEKPINGICTIYAEHISYELNHIPVMPFAANTCAEALNSLKAHAGQDCPFDVWTNKSVTGTYQLKEPMAFRELLGGTRGSILDVYGTGEYEFDKWLVRLYLHRGTDTGVVIRYAKNLTDLTKDETLEEVYTGVCPYWKSNEDDTLVMLPEIAIWASTAANYPYKRTAIVDFSDEFEEKPTVAQLRARTNQYITANNIGIPKVNIDVSFIPLWQTSGASIGSWESSLVIPATVNGDTLEHVNATVNGDTVYLHDAYWKVTITDYQALERVHLCDTISVVYDALGVSFKAEVIKTVYDVLRDRYESIEIGEPKTTLASIVTGIDEEITETKEGGDAISERLMAYVDHQTELITGGLGGYVIIGLNAGGEPEEILIMDTADKATATNVIRINKNGIGFSRSGYSGPFTSAWTIDGIFNTDFIGAGSITGTQIAGNTITGDNIAAGAITVGKLGNDVKTQINTAQATADAKTTTYYSTSNPSAGDYQAGDIWVKKSSSGVGGDVMWTYSGTAWIKHEIGTTSILQGSITTDRIAAGAVTTDELSLFGRLGVYTSNTLLTNGGYIGYMTGSAGSVQTTGIGMMDTNEDNYLIVTDAGIRATNTSGTNDTEMWMSNGLVRFTGTDFRVSISDIHLNYDGSAYSGTTYANEIRLPNNKPISSTNGAGSASFWMLYSDSSNNTYLGNTGNGTIVRGTSISLNGPVSASSSISATGIIGAYYGSTRVSHLAIDTNHAGMVSIYNANGTLMAELWRSSNGYGVLSLCDSSGTRHNLTPTHIDKVRALP